MKRSMFGYSFWQIKHLIILCIKSKITGLPNIVNDLETSEVISSGKYSVCRFGDGEIDLMSGLDLKFQNYSQEISKRLKEIIQSENNGIMVCIPNVFSWNGLKHLTIESQNFWIYHILEKYDIWEENIKKDKKYYDASVSRPYIRNKNKEKATVIFSNLKQLWENKEILIVEGNKSKLGVGNNLFSKAKKINRILCPSKNAFEVYDSIFENVKKYSEDKIIIIALGPTATILAYDLAKLGKVAIDLGHIDLEYEWYLRKVQGRTEIEGKAINELDYEGDEYIPNSKYESEILMEIK